MHEMLNFVTGPAGQPSAVQTAALENVSGPGRLTRALGIDRHFNARPALSASGLGIEDDGFRLPRGAITATPRIGVA